MITITITGTGAAAIEAANNASFYGIHKICPECTPGAIAATNAVRDYLEANHIDWNSFWISKARTIDTSGTKVSYKAEIDFDYD